MTGLDGAKLGMMAALTFGVACGSGDLSDDRGSTGGATSAGGGGAKATTASSSAVSTGSAGVGGMGGAPPVCDPPAPAGSLWALSAQQYGQDAPTSMCDYRGDVLLIVNTADV